MVSVKSFRNECGVQARNGFDAFKLLWMEYPCHCYRQVSNISGTLVGYKIVDHSDVVGASPVGAAPTTSLFSS